MFAKRHHHQRGEDRMAQGVLGFQYEAAPGSGGLTGFAGLGVYLDLIQVSGLAAAVRRHLRVAGRQGWLDMQMTVAVIALNLCGGERVEDLERLEAIAGETWRRWTWTRPWSRAISARRFTATRSSRPISR